MKNNLFILTEESITIEEIEEILRRISKKRSLNIKFSSIRILPTIINNKFNHEYTVEGFESNEINKIFIHSIAPAISKSPFIDFLVYLQVERPKPKDMFKNCVYAIEATKTNSYDSRNTAMGQRSSKFVHLSYYLESGKYQTIPVMYKTKDQTGDTDSIEFIGKLLNHLPVKTEFWGAKISKYKKFESLEDLIQAKNKISKTNTRNNDTPIFIERKAGSIRLSGKLSNPGSDGKQAHKYTGQIKHDPNQGQLSIIAKSIREFGFQGRIIICDHDLQPNAVARQDNKFTKFANYINFEIEGCEIKDSYFTQEYFKYLESGQEKIASILAQVILTNKGMHTIFENHGGCEKSFINIDPLGKSKKYKIFPKSYSQKERKIPDLIMLDARFKKIYLYEAKISKNKIAGMKEIKLYEDLETNILGEYFPDYSFERRLIIEGGIMDNDNVVSFQLDKDSQIHMKGEFI
jgi:hypothetical protein